MYNRIVYLDCLRGIVMLMVVFCHVCVFCLDIKDFFVAHVFGEIMLPSFFFISGWFSPICLNRGGNTKTFETYAYTNYGHVSNIYFCVLGKFPTIRLLSA